MAKANNKEKQASLWPLTQAAILLLLCLGLFFMGLDQRPLWEGPEARQAEAAREMLAVGELTTPLLNYQPDFQQPPLAYWLVVGSYKLLGVSEASLRLVPAIFGLLAVLLTYLLGRYLWDDWAGFSAGLVLLFCPGFVGLARSNPGEMALALGLLLTLYGAWGLIKEAGWGLWVFWLGAAMAFLSGGLAGLASSLAVVLLYAALGRKVSLVRDLFRPQGPGLFLLLCLPWVIWASLKHPGFLGYLLLDQPGWLGIGQGPWRLAGYLLLALPAAFFPWLAYLPWGLADQQAPKARSKAGARATAAERPGLLLWLAAVAWLTLLGLGQAVIAPLLPLLALLVARPLSQWRVGAGVAASPAQRRSLTALAGLIVLAGVALLVATGFLPESSPAWLGAAGFVLLALMGALGLGTFALRHRPWALWAAPLVCSVLLGAAAYTALPALEPLGSLRGLMGQVSGQLQDQDALVSYGSFHGGAAFYAQRRLVAASWPGPQPASGPEELGPPWFLPDQQALFKLLEGKKRVFVLCPQDEAQGLMELARVKYRLPLFQWAAQGRMVILANRPRV